MITATWFKRENLLIVRPSDWPPRCELSFSEQDMMTEWAQGRGIILKNIKRKEKST